LVLAYIADGVLLLAAMGRRRPIEVMNGTFAVAWLSLSAVWLGWQYLRSPRRFRQAVSARRALGAILVAALVVPTQTTFQSLKQSIGPVFGFHADPLLHRADVLLHGGMAWRWFEPLLMNPALVHAIDVLYMGWFALLFLFLFWASWSSRRVLRQRALLAFFLMWVAAGTATAWFASSAGPCYYGQVVSGADPYRPLLKRLDAIGSQHGGLMARYNQEQLWKLSRADKWQYFAGISAMPSLHVAIAVLIALVALQRSLVLGFLLISYAALIQAGSVMLAWHYAVDGYLGTVFAILCWHLAGALVRKPVAADHYMNIEPPRLVHATSPAFHKG
jgi:hypothetical protein